MGSTSTTVTANWTVVSNASVSGDDVTVTSGEAWSDIDLMAAIPAGATITDMTFSLTAEITGSRLHPTTAVSPLFQLIDKAEYIAGTWIFGYGNFGAGGVGNLPDDNDPHFITYDNVTYAAVSGGGGVFDLDAFAAALSNPSTPVILRALGPQQATAGSSITYSAPLTFTFLYDTGGPTVVPPLRQYPRPDGLGAGSARRMYPVPPTIQASNRRGPSAIL